MGDRTCPTCAAPVEGRRDKVYCSERCRKKAENARRPQPRHKCRCAVCDVEFVATRSWARYCSKACEGRAKAIRYAGMERAPKRWSNLRWTECGTCGWWRSRRGRRCPKWRDHPPAPPFDCRGCGQRVVPGETADRRARAWCSKRCKQRSRKRINPEARQRRNAARRARLRGATVERFDRAEIFERDGWRCQICRKALRRDALVPHPLAPTIDHIVPLACGGSHEPRNVQAAHFMCNSHKRDGAANDQLRLV